MVSHELDSHIPAMGEGQTWESLRVISRVKPDHSSSPGHVPENWFLYKVSRTKATARRASLKR